MKLSNPILFASILLLAVSCSKAPKHTPYAEIQLNTEPTEAAYDENLKILEEYSNWMLYHLNELSKAQGFEYPQPNSDWSEMKDFTKHARQMNPDEDTEKFWGRQQASLMSLWEYLESFEGSMNRIEAIQKTVAENETSQKATEQRLPVQN